MSFLAISIDEAEHRSAVEKVVNDLGLTYPVGLDPNGRVLRHYTPSGSIPLTLVISKKGEFVYRNGNFEPGDELPLAEAVARAAE